jgi:hypothetical protein
MTPLPTSPQGKQISKKIKGIDVAVQPVRVVMMYTKDDDLGIESDEPISDSQTIYVSRDTKNPKKFAFAGYAH